MSLKGYIVRRTINMAMLILAVLVFNFFIFRLQVFLFGIDPADLILPPNPRDKEIWEAKLREKWRIPQKGAGLDQWLDHFFTYMANMLTLQFGNSFFYQGKSVTDLILERLPNTVILLGTASLFSIILGIVVGVIAAARRGSKVDMTSISVGLALYSLPIFWLGLMAIMIFAYYIPLFPVTGGSQSVKCGSGQCNLLETIIDYIYHLILPVSVLTVGSFGGYMLLMRNNLIDVLTEDFITTAKAKGLKERTVLFRHALKNAILPMVTVIALSFAFVIGGATLTETVFNWYGLGRFIFESIIRQDWNSSQAIFYVIAVVVIVANFIADLLYGVLDPRVKYA